MDKFSFLNAAHAGFIADLYDQYLVNPDTVEASWRSFFQGYDLANENYAINGEENSVEIPEQIHKEFRVLDLQSGWQRFCEGGCLSRDMENKDELVGYVLAENAFFAGKDPIIQDSYLLTETDLPK